MAVTEQLSISVKIKLCQQIITRGDNSKKACFKRTTKFFWESRDFAGNPETGNFLGKMKYFWDIAELKSKV